MKQILILAAMLSIFLFLSMTIVDDSGGRDYRAERKRQNYIYGTRPSRIDEPLREDNVFDEEVREILAVTAAIYPGAIANISGVTTDCPCEDGPTCDSQAWILVHRDSRYDGLMLSRIDSVWTVGPLQSWWFSYDNLGARTRKVLRARDKRTWEVFRALMDERIALEELFPYCSDENGKDGS